MERNNNNTKYHENKIFVPVIDSKDELEARVTVLPADRVPTPYDDLGIVLTHPMPMLGGDMHNNVTIILCQYLSRNLGCTCIRFNFRGVGNSTVFYNHQLHIEDTEDNNFRLIQFNFSLWSVRSLNTLNTIPKAILFIFEIGRGSWRGGKERDDVRSVCKYLVSQPDHKIKRVLLVGYSYGSAIACSVANDIPEVIGYTAISYPFGPLTIMLLGYLLDKAKTTKPKLFLMGTNDNFTGVSKFRDRIAKFPEPKEEYLFNNIDHFYFDKEIELAQKIDEWIRRTF